MEKTKRWKEVTNLHQGIDNGKEKKEGPSFPFI